LILKKLIVNILQYLAFLLLGVFLFWLSFRKLEFKDVWEDIVSANYFWLALSVLVTLISHYFRALRWNLLIESMGYKTRSSSTFYALMIGYMANTAVPRMGEFMRCGVLTRKENISFNALFGTVISERLFDLMVLFVFLFTVVAFQWDLLGDFVIRMTGPFRETLSGNIISIAILTVILLIGLAFVIWMYFRKQNRLHQLPGYQRLKDIITGLTQGVRTIDRMKQKGRFLVYTFIIWFFYILMMYLPFKMLPETSHLTFVAGITMLAIGSLGIVAPVPGGIGAYHFIGMAVLTELYGIPLVTAGSFVAITHAAQTLLNVLVGAFGYVLLFFIDHKPPQNAKA